MQGLCQDLQQVVGSREPQVRPETGPVSEPLSLGGSKPTQLKYVHMFCAWRAMCTHVVGHFCDDLTKAYGSKSTYSCSVQNAHLHMASSQCHMFSRFPINCLRCVSEGLVLFGDGILTTCPPIDACSSVGLWLTPRGMNHTQCSTHSMHSVCLN